MLKVIKFLETIVDIAFDKIYFIFEKYIDRYCSQVVRNQVHIVL